MKKHVTKPVTLLSQAFRFEKRSRESELLIADAMNITRPILGTSPRGDPALPETLFKKTLSKDTEKMKVCQERTNYGTLLNGILHPSPIPTVRPRRRVS